MRRSSAVSILLCLSHLFLTTHGASLFRGRKGKATAESSSDEIISNKGFADNAIEVGDTVDETYNLERKYDPTESEELRKMLDDAHLDKVAKAIYVPLRKKMHLHFAGKEQIGQEFSCANENDVQRLIHGDKKAQYEAVNRIRKDFKAKQKEFKKGLKAQSSGLFAPYA